jgi:hypothetical protein
MGSPFPRNCDALRCPPLRAPVGRIVENGPRWTTRGTWHGFKARNRALRRWWRGLGGVFERESFAETCMGSSSCVGRCVLRNAAAACERRFCWVAFALARATQVTSSIICFPSSDLPRKAGILVPSRVWEPVLPHPVAVSSQVRRS